MKRALAAVVLGAFLLAGCSGQQDPAPAATYSPEPTAAAPSASATVDDFSDLIETTPPAPSRSPVPTRTKATTRRPGPTSRPPTRRVRPTPSPETGGTIPCKDGTVSHAKHRQGACSHHGGIA